MSPPATHFAAEWRTGVAKYDRQRSEDRSSLRGEIPLDEEEARLLAVLRFIGAAYDTDDAACWEAAHHRAEETLDTVEAAQLVGRAAAVVRVIRIDRTDFGFLPPPCRRLSRDETALFELLRAVPRERHAMLACAGRILDNVGGVRLLASAAFDVVAPRLATAPFPARDNDAAGELFIPRIRRFKSFKTNQPGSILKTVGSLFGLLQSKSGSSRGII